MSAEAQPPRPDALTYELLIAEVRVSIARSNHCPRSHSDVDHLKRLRETVDKAIELGELAAGLDLVKAATFDVVDVSRVVVLDFARSQIRRTMTNFAAIALDCAAVYAPQTSREDR